MKNKIIASLLIATSLFATGCTYEDQSLVEKSLYKKNEVIVLNYSDKKNECNYVDVFMYSKRSSIDKIDSIPLGEDKIIEFIPKESGLYIFRFYSASGAENIQTRVEVK